jgi:hypothetical protein
MGISTGDVSAGERESGSTAAAKEQCTATPTLKSWMARVRKWCSDTGGHVGSDAERGMEEAKKAFEMKDRVIVVMVLRASNKTEERVDSEDGEGMAFMRDGKQYSYKDVAWSGKMT